MILQIEHILLEEGIIEVNINVSKKKLEWDAQRNAHKMFKAFRNFDKFYCMQFFIVRYISQQELKSKWATYSKLIPFARLF